ncbi:hypothetical protein DFH06DRAFT_293710 [Mycena polygramma]|nr:hypothetical protein DFH06DRAFT_293710 [Mycena polygramma]
MAPVFGLEPSYARSRAPSSSLTSTAPNPSLENTASTLDAGLPQLTAKNIVRQCEMVFECGKPQTLFFPHFTDFSPKIYKRITQCWADSHSSLSLKLTSSAAYPIIMQFMPLGPHETAVAGLSSLMAECFMSQTGLDSWLYFVPLGSRRIKLDNPYKRAKEADASFAPPASTKNPSVIIEVVSSEIIKELRSDMANWLSLHSIKLVILIEITKRSPPMPNSPKLTVETWYKSMDDTQQRSTIAAETDWTDAVTDAFSIPLWTLLGLEGPGELPADLPQFFSIPQDALAGLRQRIIDECTAEDEDEEEP